MRAASSSPILVGGAAINRDFGGARRSSTVNGSSRPVCLCQGCLRRAHIMEQLAVPARRDVLVERARTEALGRANAR